MFIELRRLYFLTCADCQKSFQTEVYAYALTCLSHRFGRSIIGDNIEPVFTRAVTKDLDIADISVPVAVLVKRKPHTIDFQGVRLCIPRFERETYTPLFKCVACLELGRTVSMFSLRFRRTALTSKKTLVSSVNTNNRSIQRVAWYPSPVFLGRLEQLSEVRLQPISPCVFPIDAVISLFKTQKVIMHITQVIKHIPEAFVLSVIAYFVFIGAHSFLQHSPPTPLGLGRDPALQRGWNSLPTMLEII